jgi:hypothetical protein
MSGELNISSRSLEWLDVSSTEVGDSFLRMMTFPNLRHLGLEDTSVTTRGLRYLSHSLSAKSLRSLCIRGVRRQLEDDFSTLLKAFPALKMIEMDDDIEQDMKDGSIQTSLVGQLIQEQFESL